MAVVHTLVDNAGASRGFARWKGRVIRNVDALERDRTTMAIGEEQMAAKLVAEMDRFFQAFSGQEADTILTFEVHPASFEFSSNQTGDAEQAANLARSNALFLAAKRTYGISPKASYKKFAGFLHNFLGRPFRPDGKYTYRLALTATEKKLAAQRRRLMVRTAQRRGTAMEDISTSEEEEPVANSSRLTEATGMQRSLWAQSRVVLAQRNAEVARDELAAQEAAEEMAALEAEEMGRIHVRVGKKQAEKVPTVPSNNRKPATAHVRPRQPVSSDTESEISVVPRGKNNAARSSAAPRNNAVRKGKRVDDGDESQSRGASWASTASTSSSVFDRAYHEDRYEIPMPRLQYDDWNEKKWYEKWKNENLNTKNHMNWNEWKF